VEIKYLYHSGVSISYEDTLFIFDYYKKGVSEEDIFRYEKIYVFVSHGHRDHFDREILSWKGLDADIQYIFSSDTGIDEAENCHVMKPHETYTTEDLAIYTLDSTDEGVAFLVKSPKGSIFHSGDLNWWHWEGEPDEYNNGMGNRFKEEIDRLKSESVEIAFIPVDKRLGTSQYYSIDYLMETIDVKRVCPIHFWDDWEYIERVKRDLVSRKYYNKIYFYGR